MLGSNSSNKNKYLSIIYWTVGIGIIIWSCYAEQKFGPEGALGALWLIIFLALPVSYPFSAAMFDVTNRFWPNNGATVIPLFLILTLGYLQWFYFFPFCVKSFSRFNKRKL